MGTEVLTNRVGRAGRVKGKYQLPLHRQPLISINWHIQMNGEIKLSHRDRAYERAADHFGLLSTPTRLRIVCALMEGECNVSDLVERLAVSQPTMSQHHGLLYRAGILGRRRDGAQVFYRVDHGQVRSPCGAVLPCDPIGHVATTARRRYTTRPV